MRDMGALKGHFFNRAHAEPALAKAGFAGGARVIVTQKITLKKQKARRGLRVRNSEMRCEQKCAQSTWRRDHYS